MCTLKRYKTEFWLHIVALPCWQSQVWMQWCSEMLIFSSMGGSRLFGKELEQFCFINTTAFSCFWGWNWFHLHVFVAKMFSMLDRIPCILWCSFMFFKLSNGSEWWNNGPSFFPRVGLTYHSGHPGHRSFEMIVLFATRLGCFFFQSVKLGILNICFELCIYISKKHSFLPSNLGSRGTA